MCFSNNGSAAAKQQQQQTDQRNAAIDATSTKVNSLFDSPQRQAQVQDYQNAVQQRGMSDLQDTFDQNARSLKFATARNGLTGGSADVDQTDLLNKDYGKGVLQVLANAKQAGSNLTAADEASRSRLLSQVASGYDLNGALSQGTSALQSNLQGASANIAPQALDSLFGNLSDYYDASTVNASRRAAEQAGIGTLFNTNSYGYGYPRY